MYPAQWHKTYGDKTGASARTIMPPLVQAFGVRSLVEIGCGNAHWTQASIDAGIEEYSVVDGPWNKLDDLLVERSCFVEHLLSHPLDLGRRFDLAICLEVAEHVAKDAAATLVKSLTDAADVVIFGAAIPLQGGFGHVNEQWQSWWRDIFARQGYEAFDIIRPLHWTDQTIHYWYRQNTFVYASRDNAAAVATATELERSAYRSTILFDAVHPEKYEEMVSYRAIAMKRLLRQLPGWVYRRVRARFG